jgi:inner membrane transporter RhtA
MSAQQTSSTGSTGSPGPTPAGSAPGPASGADSPPAAARSAPLLVLASMSFVQLGLALSRGLFPRLGVIGTTGLRLVFAALILVALARPRIAGKRPRDLAAVALLGVASGTMTLLMAAALDRIPLALATTIEFLGPFGVALVRSRRVLGAVWAAGAIIGVALITQPGFAGHGRLDPVGLLFAAAGALCWATYIVFTSKVGKIFDGFQGLAISMLVAAVAVMPFGVREVWHGLSVDPHPARLLLLAAGLAVLLPVAPYVLEMTALRRMPEHIFSILMSLEPGISALMGLLVLAQSLAPVQISGIACVITVSIAATVVDRRRTLATPSHEIDAATPAAREAT